MSAFARERGLGAHRLWYWRDRLEGAEGPPPESKLVPGVLVGLAAEAAVSVRLPSGVVVEVHTPHDVGPEWVAELVQALQEAP